MTLRLPVVTCPAGDINKQVRAKISMELDGAMVCSGFFWSCIVLKKNKNCVIIPESAGAFGWNAQSS